MAEVETITLPFIEEGNNGFDIYTLNADGTHGAGENIKGMVSFSGNITMETTNLPADDDTTYFSRGKPVTADGTVAFRGLTVADYKKMYNNCTDSNNVLILGRRGMTKKVGIAFNNTRVYSDGTTSENRICFLNLTFSLPSIETQTIAEDDDTVRPFSVPFKANPYNYINKNGKRDHATISLPNSKDNSDIWDKVKDKLYIPDMDLTDLI
ncbi:MAG: hypothetical protein K2O94_00910 [Clostridiales bacterium]|nr:hypothetical protein [Clostridiales bacterium]